MKCPSQCWLHFILPQNWASIPSLPGFPGRKLPAPKELFWFANPHKGRRLRKFMPRKLKESKPLIKWSSTAWQDSSPCQGFCNPDSNYPWERNAACNGQKNCLKLAWLCVKKIFFPRSKPENPSMNTGDYSYLHLWCSSWGKAGKSGKIFPVLSQNFC